MANKFEEAEFWLPSEFLTDDEILMGHANLLKTEGRMNEFSGSPVESFVGSTETDSDEEDALAGLIRQLSRTTLNSNQPQHQIERNWVHCGSPQSTLAQIGSWSGSSNGSPSPPTTPLGAQNDAWNLIYEAAGQVAKLKMHGGFGLTKNQGIPGPPRSVYPSGPNSCFTSTHFEQARMEQMARQQSSAMLNRQVKNGWPDCQNRGLRSGFGVEGFVENNGCGRVVGQTVWSGLPNQYQGQVGLGMRVGRLGGSVKKRECAGTGVFLPRRYCSHNPADTRKKPGCSTAWLPAGVVESLNNKKIDDFNAGPHTPTQHRFNAGFLSDYDVLMARRNAVLAQQERNLQPEGSMYFEVRLPQEWTY
ncbi:hypothetical protein K7X08_023171 [Anisodus acutangulus]|uniref:Uncharacterized protein n=1 Tax=Anisodus acutangulus TaxID=402998 RepID=A0A9Q1LHM6_9SOLA|nr:hypothetical protein K7X08_023171 [Anisodus acutangulus]